MTLRVFLAFTLLSAAVLKAYTLATGEPQVGVLITNRWLLGGSVEIELVLALWLLSGTHRVGAWWMVTACFSVYVVVAGYEAVSGRSSCGCFGSIRASPWYTFTFDLLVLAALLYCRVDVISTQAKPSRQRVGWFAAIAILLCSAAGIAIAASRPLLLANLGEITVSGLVVLEPEHWVGKRLALLEFIDRREEIVSGNWIIVLYRYDCDHCRVAIPKFEAKARAGQKIALIEMPPYASPGESPISPNSPCLLGRLRDKPDWFATTPVVLTLRDGIVQSAAQGDQAEKLAANR